MTDNYAGNVNDAFSVNDEDSDVKEQPTFNNTHSVDSKTTVTSLTSNSEESNGSEIEIITYKSRYWILIGFAFICWYQYVIWGTWGPISESAIEALDWEGGTVAMMGNWGPIAFIIAIAPICISLEKYGLRLTTVVCVILIAIGTTTRTIAILFLPSAFTISCHICGFLNGVVGPLVMAAPAKIASDWFPANQRTSAMAVLQTANYIGGFATYSEPLLVRQPSKDVTAEMIQDDISLLMFIQNGFTLLYVIPILVYFPSLPPTPPSISSSKKQEESLQKSFMKLLKKRDALLVLLSAGLCVGITTALSSVLTLIVKDLGVDQNEAMWLGISSLIGTGILAVLVGVLTDILYGHLKITLITLIGASLASYFWFFLLATEIINTVHWQIFVSMIAGVSITYSTFTLFFQFAIELSYPLPSILVGGSATLLTNVAALIFLGLLSIPDIGYSWTTYCILGFGAASLVPLAFAKENYFRSDMDKKQNV